MAFGEVGSVWRSRCTLLGASGEKAYNIRKGGLSGQLAIAVLREVDWSTFIFYMLNMLMLLLKGASYTIW